jgi:PAS domain S-box-containing protein
MRVEQFQRALGPFVTAAEVTRMPIAFTDTCVDHAIIFANDSFLKLTGYRREDVIGQSFAGLLAGSGNPKTLEMIELQFSDSDDVIEVDCARKDRGRVRTALHVTPVHDRQGAVVQYFSSLVDLTEQMQRIRHERSALHVLYQKTPDFIAITEGPDHRFTFANAAYQQLVGDRELLGRTMIEALPELAGQDIRAHRDQVYRTGEPFVASALAVTLQRQAGADVERRYLHLIYQPVLANDGRVTGIFCEGHDVTDQEALAVRLAALEVDIGHLRKLSGMGTMAATLAHEMTQPLTAIANYSAVCGHLIANPEENREQIAEILRAIDAAAHRGGDIIHKLQQLTERRSSPRDQFRLRDAVDESVATVRAAGCGNASIVARCAEQIEVAADRTQIQQVLTNLLRNGCEAVGPSGGRVILSAIIEQGKVVVSIKDNGAGVSPEAARTLFHWADSTKQGGSGIGLSICKTIVEGHGGALWLKQSGHTGACFAFSLPLAPGDCGEEGDPLPSSHRAAA